MHGSSPATSSPRQFTDYATLRALGNALFLRPLSNPFIRWFLILKRILAGTQDRYLSEGLALTPIPVNIALLIVQCHI
jgi:hypothetical protein